MIKILCGLIIIVVMYSNIHAEEISSLKKPDLACLKEIYDRDKIINKNKAYNECINSVVSEDNLKMKFSSSCQKEFELNKMIVTINCKNEQVRARLTGSMDLFNCAQKISPLSFTCSEQYKSYIDSSLEVFKKCSDAYEKVSNLCGVNLIENEKCYEEHRAELEDICLKDLRLLR